MKYLTINGTDKIVGAEAKTDWKITKVVTEKGKYRFQLTHANGAARDFDLSRHGHYDQGKWWCSTSCGTTVGKVSFEFLRSIDNLTKHIGAHIK